MGHPTCIIEGLACWLTLCILEKIICNSTNSVQISFIETLKLIVFSWTIWWCYWQNVLMINEKNNFLTVSWLSGLLSAEIFISTGEWGVQMPPLTSENSYFLRSGPQGATLVMYIHNRLSYIRTAAFPEQISLFLRIFFGVWSMLSISVIYRFIIGRTVPLLKPPQSSHCWGGWPREINPDCEPGLIVLIGPLRPYCSQALWSCGSCTCVTEIKFDQTCVDLEIDIRMGIPSTLHIELKVEWNF